MTAGVAPSWSSVERAARDAYGQLVATLAFRFRDLAAVEDALGDALHAALVHWPKTGVPESPKAWLLTAAKNKMLQAARHRSVTERPDTLLSITSELETRAASSPESFGDHRLRLMFVCAHPAIDEHVRTPLMLQTVLGLDAAAIGAQFLLPAATMGQRLVRAKRKIRDACIPFDPPEGPELEDRLSAVLEGIYAAFGAADGTNRGTTDESLFLAELLAALMPSEPEALGLHALLRFSSARRAASRGDDGEFVPLAQQDVRRWDRASIVAAEEVLRRAAALRKPGPFQLEAAIQSAHCQRLFSGRTPWQAIAYLYQALNAIAPTAGSVVGHAVALAELGDLDGARDALSGLDDAHTTLFQPYWVARAHLAHLGNDLRDRRHCLERAVALTEDMAVRTYLVGQLRGP